ncbi:MULTISPECIES: hypothetical protein [Candidatus Cardinium]|uniref:hypothetical protein n=1 Tax=Candidatus Cardinium TaxID=273135 RepID=UPI001FAB22BB|nr:MULTISPECIES: hypothetical protein [Cardinium]
MYIRKKIFTLLLFFVAVYTGHAVSQDFPSPTVVDTPEQTEPDTYLPPIENYPSLMIELLKADFLYSLDSTLSIPFQKVKKLDWSSLLRKNGAFLYSIRINKSRFALSLGCGWSTLYYAFTGRQEGGDTIYMTLKRSDVSRTDCEDLVNEAGKKYAYSAINIPFIDFLFRLRFNSVLHEPKAGFHGWLGGKVGVRRPASTITHYEEYKDPGASSVCEGNFNLKRLAFGIQAGIGYHRFGLVGGFNLTPLFEGKEGPVNAHRLRPFSLAIYVDLI